MVIQLSIVNPLYRNHLKLPLRPIDQSVKFVLTLAEVSKIPTTPRYHLTLHGVIIACVLRHLVLP